MTEATQLLRDLVQIPSVNPMGRELPAELALETRLTDYLESYFTSLGVSYDLQWVAPGRNNIIAMLPNPASGRTLLLEVHQDTVPVDGMTVAPFGGEIRDGKLYGRGACDVKGGMAAMLACFARLARERPPQRCKVLLACSVDEEHTMLGVQALARRGLPADFAVVAEPTSLNIVHAHKGVVRWRLTTSGRSCHSSTPHLGVNAIYRMAHVLTAVERYAADLAQRPADPLLGPPTLSAGRIEGGSSVNTVPDGCAVELDRRLLPSESAASAREELAAFLAQHSEVPVALEPMGIEMAALSPAGSETLRALLGAAIDRARGSHRVHAVAYGTDASALAAAGIPSVVFGPGDIAQAHTRDEWIAMEEVDQAAEILFDLACSTG